MSAEGASGAMSGAASGAAAGAMVGGPIGAVIGGIIGGVAGLFGGKKAAKARKFAEKAAKVERQQAQLQAGTQRRDMIRQARIARAQTIAAGAAESGGLQSSSVLGAASSVNSQLTSNLGYFDWQVGLGNEAQNYRAKAGKYARSAQAIQGGISALSSIASVAGSLQGPAATPNKAGSSTNVGMQSGNGMSWEGTPSFLPD